MVTIVRPTLLLNESICKDNIRRMAQKARASNVNFRPHFKTHQSLGVGEWFKAEGVNSCTVSSVKMAAYFADGGWKDITIAFPLNYLESDEINRIASISTVNVLAVSAEGVQQLGKRLKHSVGCFIEIDPGYHRTGVDPKDYAAIDEVLAAIDSVPMMTFRGFLCHSGHSYALRSASDVMKVYDETLSIMKGLDDHYRKDHPAMILSIGDTPTCTVSPSFKGLNEVRPGNMVFYDMMQVGIGSCTRDNIAIAMACPVVATEPDREEIFIHGGAVHFSKDFQKRDDGRMSFGEVVRLKDNGWEFSSAPMYLKSLSQEHGVIHASKEDIAKVQIGDIVGVLPIHACLTADMMAEYTTLEGDVITMMKR